MDPLERQSLQQAGSQCVDEMVVAHSGGGPDAPVLPPLYSPGADLVPVPLLFLGCFPAPLKRLEQEREVGDLEVPGTASDRREYRLPGGRKPGSSGSEAKKGEM